MNMISEHFGCVSRKRSNKTKTENKLKEINIAGSSWNPNPVWICLQVVTLKHRCKCTDKGFKSDSLNRVSLGRTDPNWN